jgi:hypothetical protein
MAVDQCDVVDFVHETGGGEIWLTISDHLPWDEGFLEHLFVLQEKLNTYLRFIESGELIQRYPEAMGRRVVINLGCQFPPSDSAQRFIDYASTIITEAGIGFQLRILPDN